MVSQPQIKDRRAEYGFHDDIIYLHEAKRGLTRGTVEEISAIKGEPEWMLQHRLRAYEHWLKRPMPMWTEGLDKIDYENIIYYRKPSEREEKSWDDVPDQIKDTFERLGIPEAERAFLSGVGAQYDSEVVYHSVKEELSKLGVVFMGTDQALKEYPEIFREHYGTVVPPEDNKFSALNSAVWSGGSFVYVPPGVEVPLPLQAYFRINGENTGQFERTLIVVDEGASVHYIEGCTAPIYATDSLHVAVVEVIAKARSKVRYTTIQNWSNDVYNLVTKRAHAYEDSHGRVDRRQHRLQEDGQVPQHLPAWTRGQGGHHLRGGGRGGPAPGHRCQGHPPRARHAQPHRQQVRLQGQRPGHLSWPGQGRARGHQRGRQHPL